jgi:thiamine-phosphate pyrophosphorylase
MAQLYNLSEIVGKEYVKKVCRFPFVEEKSTTNLMNLINKPLRGSPKMENGKWKMESEVKDKIKISSYGVLKYVGNVIPENFKRESVLRIIDANLNRCREGLRVVEDGLRFVLNDSFLYKKTREIRHSVDKILRNSYGELIKERNSFYDSGRQMPEISKKGLAGIITANFKRTQESLRVLEEYSKTLFPKASADFKKQRYATYDVEKSVYLKYRKFLL